MKKSDMQRFRTNLDGDSVPMTVDEIRAANAMEEHGNRTVMIIFGILLILIGLHYGWFTQ